MTTTLAIAHGRNARADRAALVTLSNDGMPWQNNGKTLRGLAGPARSWGMLNPSLRPVVAQADFVVYSFQTPIAWRVCGVWTVDTANYSATTNRHLAHVGALVP